MTVTLEELETRVTALERADYRLILSRVLLLESRFDGVETGLRERFDGMDKRFDGMDKRFDVLEAKMDTQYTALMTAIRTSGGTQ